MALDDRATLHRVPLSDVPLSGGPRPPGFERFTVTISVWQPMTAVHRAAYDQGGYLLELDRDEQPVRAYHRLGPLPVSGTH